MLAPKFEKRIFEILHNPHLVIRDHIDATNLPLFHVTGGVI